MSAYTDAVESGMQGMTAISSGTCPGCERCMEIDGHSDEQEHRVAWESEDLASAEPSFSWCPCGICGTTLGGDRYTWHWIDTAQLKARDEYHETLKHMPIGARVPAEPAVEINHERDMCTDCALYLANGDEPEDWRRR